MAIQENVTYELEGRLRALDLGKTHLSVRYEPEAKLVRVGACLSDYNWESRDRVIDALLEFEDSHADEYAVEFDVAPGCARCSLAGLTPGQVAWVKRHAASAPRLSEQDREDIATPLAYMRTAKAAADPTITPSE